jgi:PBP1b-binding outer membrane lipoprotein LpoB
MKKIALVLLTIIFAAGCSSTKTAQNNATDTKSAANGISFEYEASTRGAYKKVVVTKDSIVTIQDRSMKDMVSKPTPKGDWDRLTAFAEKVNLEGLEALKAPSNKNHADAALAANLKVIKDGKTYGSTTFDHGNPPAEIAPLVNRIIAMSDLKTK